jgi:hypothetical protein
MDAKDHSLTRQEEDLSVVEYDAEETLDTFDFGNWPELAGLVGAALVCWLLFAFTG